MTPANPSPAPLLLLVFLGAVLLVGVFWQHAAHQASAAPTAVLINREPAVRSPSENSTQPLFPGIE